MKFTEENEKDVEFEIRKNFKICQWAEVKEKQIF